jgi:hypothetical protein
MSEATLTENNAGGAVLYMRMQLSDRRPAEMACPSQSGGAYGIP